MSSIASARSKLKTYHMTYVEWNSPPHGWIKLNTNGSFIQPHHIASCGGLIRNQAGEISIGFVANLGNCPITMANLRRIYVGLRLTFDMGRRNVILENDSLCTTRLSKGLAT